MLVSGFQDSHLKHLTLEFSQPWQVNCTNTAVSLLRAKLATQRSKGLDSLPCGSARQSPLQPGAAIVSIMVFEPGATSVRCVQTWKIERHGILRRGGQQNSAGLVGMVEGNDRGLMVGNLGRADHDRAGWVACCGRGIKVERNKQR